MWGASMQQRAVHPCFVILVTNTEWILGRANTLCVECESAFEDCCAGVSARWHIHHLAIPCHVEVRPTGAGAADSFVSTSRVTGESKSIKQRSPISAWAHCFGYGSCGLAVDLLRHCKMLLLTR